MSELRLDFLEPTQGANSKIKMDSVALTTILVFVDGM